MPARTRTDVGDVVPNQVFIGCSWKTARPKYERIIDDLKKKYPFPSSSSEGGKIRKPRTSWNTSKRSYLRRASQYSMRRARFGSDLPGADVV